ncbi:MAG: FHIPEP family type III secretion protein [Arsenophonus sp.]|nr:FHIPEP family type III secretion protein [Arsenophonus sp.]
MNEFYGYFSQVITRNIGEFFGIQETKDLLDQLEKKYPELLKECYRHVSIQRITEVLQRLLQEQISIRNIKIILGGLVQWGPKEKDPIMLVEQIRALLARYITASFIFQQKLHVLIVSAELEEIIRQGIRQTSSGSFLNLEPAQLDVVQDRLLVAIKENYTIPKIVA